MLLAALISKFYIDVHTYTRTRVHAYTRTYVQPIAFGVSYLQSQNSIDYRVLYVSFVTFC